MSAVADPFADIENAMNASNEAAAKPKPVAAAAPDNKPVHIIPYWIEECHAAYKAGSSHVFLIHDNITDYPDTSGNRGDMKRLLSTVFDTAWLQNQPSMKGKKLGVQPGRVFAYYMVNEGLQFVDNDSRALWVEVLTAHAKEIGLPDKQLMGLMNPSKDITDVMNTLQFSFEAYKHALRVNKPGWFTVCFFNGNFLFPTGPIAHMQADRLPVAYVCNWAQDTAIGSRCRIMILAPTLEDIHETIRNGDSGVRSIRIRRPDVKERETWLTNFSTALGKLPDDKQEIVGGQKRNKIVFAPGVDCKVMVNQAAGLNLRKMEEIVRASWQDNSPIDIPMIASWKRRSIEQTYGGLVDFVEPEHGFEVIGGHTVIKEAFYRSIISPLRRGDKRTCAAGFILTGPPGTGKTQLALALAKVLKMNFLEGNLGKLFGGLVGDTERNTRLFFSAVESAAPCVLFMDELDFVTAGARGGGGDSGVTQRVMQSLMTFLSDQGRLGKVVVISATNRPDLLDAALIRNGRFDALIPALPPAAGDAKGRLAILKALCGRKQVTFLKDLAATVKSADAGLGRLLNDKRIWTGAEIEAVIKDAISNYVDRQEQDLVNAALLKAGSNDVLKLALSERWDLVTYEQQQAINDKMLALNEKPVLTQSDWDQAMNAVQPNTKEIDVQIDLALYYANNSKYCPADWSDRWAKVHSSSLGDIVGSNRATVLDEVSLERD